MSEPSSRTEQELPRLAVNQREAAQVLGVSVDFFHEHIGHELPCVYRGRRRLYRVKDLEAWLEANPIRAGRNRTDF